MKGLSKFAVTKPVTIMMVYLGIVLLGFICVKKLPQELFPSITYPVLSVVTNYANAAPEEIETLVTKLIEESISTVKGIKKISSVSKEGVSLITAEFNWGVNMDFAALGMREKIDLVKEQLPRDSEEPLVLKYNPYEKPVMVLSVTGTWREEDLLRFAKKTLKDKLEKLEGVASASISGGKERQILVEVDQGQLQASKIDILTVADSLRDSNLNYPAGTTKEKFYEYLIRTMGEFEKVSEIGDTVVSLDLIKKQEEEEKRRRAERGEEEEEEKKAIAGYKPVILLSDIALIQDTYKEKTSFSRYNGKDNISVAIQKQADANTIDVATRVLKELQIIQAALPPGIVVEVVYNAAIFVKNAISSVVDAAWQGGLLAFLTLLLFLKNIKNATIVTTTIPLSVMAALILMYFHGITINMLSMGGLALGIGMLLDAGVVVTENIYRHRQIGEDPKKSALDGSAEVASAVFSSTMTNVAVFLPMVFIIGIAGQLFKELAWTVVYIQIVSYFIAITWIPRLLMKERERKRPPSKRFQRWGNTIDYYMNQLSVQYERILTWFLRNRKRGIFGVFVLFMITMALFPLLEREVLPKVDQGQVTINVTLDTGTRLNITDTVVRRMEEVLLGETDILNIQVSIGSSKEAEGSGSVETLGSHQARILVNLKKDRKRTSNEFIADLREKVAKLDTAHADIEYVATESEFVGFVGGGADIAIEVKGTDMGVLKDLVGKTEEELRKNPSVLYVKNSLAQPSPEAKINVRKDKSALYNLSVKDISQTALLCIKGLVATKFKEEGNEYDILVRLRARDRESVRQLKGINIHSAQQNLEVPLNELAFITYGKGPSRIERKEQQRIIVVSANKAKAKKTSELIAEAQALLQGMRVPSGYSLRIAGQEEEVQESFRSIIFAIVLSIILVYMIMASQFESLMQPFIIMFTVPLSLIGVAMTLFITGTALSIMALLGIIILGGIVVANGIVLIEYVNQLRLEGVELEEAVVRACKIRLRPILMTAASGIVGLLPLSLGIGEGAELQAPMAKVIMGGVFTSTFLTLVVIPALYLMSEQAKSRFKARKMRIPELVAKL